MIKKITLLKIFTYLEIFLTLTSLTYLVKYIFNKELLLAMVMLIVTSIGVCASNELIRKLNYEKRRED
jgi:hypothetical protein